MGCNLNGDSPSGWAKAWLTKTNLSIGAAPVLACSAIRYQE